MTKVGIIDYGLGNIRSVAGAVEKIGATPIITGSREELSLCDKLILPGVGAFGDGMANLKSRDLVEYLSEEVLVKKKPILGICLGAQLLASESFEFGHHKGLDWISASVKKIESQDTEIRVPHVGWNHLHQVKESVLFSDIPHDALFYYVHSFYLDAANSEDVIGTCEHGVTFASVVQKENIYGTQFHPEKSQIHGLALLKNFVEKS